MDVSRGSILTELDAIDAAILAIRRQVQEYERHPEEVRQLVRAIRAKSEFMNHDYGRIRKEARA